MYFISCPSCRKPTQLPEAGATVFSTAFLINSLLQLQNKLKTVSHEVGMECEIHHDPLRVYCETCQELICRDCTISQCHQNHKHKLVTECYVDHHQEIEANLTTVKTNIAKIKAARTNFVTQEIEVTKQGEDVKKEIHTQAQLIVYLVQKSERQLVQQVDTAVQQKIHLLTKQREEAETVLNQLEDCEEFVEQNLKVGSQQQVLKEKRNMIQVMATVNEDIKPVVLEEANITFIRNQALVDKYEGIGELKSKKIGKSVIVKSACQNKKSTITLNFQTHDGSPFSVPLSLMSCELSSASDSQLVACDINETQSGNYNISFTPRTREKHQLILQLEGIDVPGSSLTLSPETRDKPVNIMSGLNRPWGVAVTKYEEIVVAEYGAHCITVLNKEGNKVSFGTKGTKKGQFMYPYGVAISRDGHILVTDEHRLQKLTFEGHCVKSVGSSEPGNGHLQFNTPMGITVHSGKIYVADRNNHRIQVLTNDLIFIASRSNSLAMNSPVPESFDCPYDVTFDNEGYLYVVDHHNHCIKKFTSSRQYIAKFGSKGSNPGQLKDPTSITIDNNLVYVSEYGNNRISIFDTNGCFIHCLSKRGKGNGEIIQSFGITIDSLGNLYVSDHGNNRLVVL